VKNQLSSFIRLIFILAFSLSILACGGGGGGGSSGGGGGSSAPALFSIKVCNPSPTASTEEVTGNAYDSGGTGSNYAINQNCSLLIQPTTNPGSPIRVSFSSFNLEANHDYLKIYDGTSAAGTPLHTGSGFSGTTLPSSVIATSGAVYIVMTTDASVVKNGFKLLWEQLPNTLPVASFTLSSTTVSLGQSITATETSTNSPTSWNWDFDGDGNVDSTAQNPTFNFTTEGIKTVTLTATNSSGSSTTTKSVYVAQRSMCNGGVSQTSTSPTGVFYDDGGPSGDYTKSKDCALLIQPSGSPSPGMITLHFNSFWLETSADYIEVYDGTSTAGRALHPSGGFTGSDIPSDVVAVTGAMYVVFKTPTTYGSNPHFGFEATWTSSVAGSPGALFTPSATVVATGGTVNFTDNSTNTPTSWAWDFNGDSVIDDTTQNPSYTFSTEGSYNVTLTVTNALGSSSYSKLIYVGTSVNMGSTASTTSAIGMLFDEGGPSANHGNNKNQTFTITPSGVSSITLSFSAFDLEERYDKLFIYDGVCDTGTALHTQEGFPDGFTGMTLPPTLTATSGSICLRFLSDPAVTRAGFSATWNSQ